MLSVSFDGCFGWLHPAKGELKSTAVVICPGLKLDDLTGYASLRLLADGFSEQGYPTLRMQYAGTGNSSDLSGDQWTTWQQNIHSAAAWMRKNSDVTQIVFCGFRFGALLATTVAANRIDVAGLILLAPVRRGRSYIRQLLMEAPTADGFVEAGRIRFSPDIVQAINQAELRKIVLAPPVKIAIFSQTASGDCEANWRKAGIEVATYEWTGLEPLLRPTFANHQPPAIIDPVVNWLCTALPEESYIRQDHEMPETFEIKSDIYAETPVWFADHTLFGILCRPQVPQSRVIVLIGNSSGDPHCGDTTADLARNLAEGGVASLRFDFRGLGDSDNIDGQCSHIFEVDRTPDYSAAIDFLEQRGFEQFAVYGLCSGAYHAYLAAVQEQRLSYGLFVNMPFFHWVHGFPVEDLVLDRRKPTYFLDHMRTSAFWAFVAYKILRGDFNLRNRLAWLRRLKPTRRQVATVDEALARRVKMLFVVCEGDTSIDVLKQEFGDPPPAGKKVELVPGLNHAMTGAIMRRLVASRFISFLESFPGTALKSDMLN